MTKRRSVWVGKFFRTVLAAAGVATAAMISAGAAQADFKTLYSFPGGYGPAAGLVIDKTGNLVGTQNISASAFKITPTGRYKLLHQFTGDEGFNPQADLIMDAQGFFYGTNRNGGAGPCGCGTVFRMSPNGAIKVLYTFVGGNSGSYPEGKLAIDAAGNLYGMTAEGGSSNLAGC